MSKTCKSSFAPPGGSARIRQRTDHGPSRAKTSPARPRPMASSWRLTWPARFSRRPIRRSSSQRSIGPSRWLLDHDVSTVNDASVMLMATAPLSSARAAALRERSVSLLRKAQSDEGGWGPFVDLSAGSVRHRAGLDRTGTGWRSRGAARPDRPRPIVPHRPAAARWKLDRDHPSSRRRKLRPAHLHHGLGRAGTPRLARKLIAFPARSETAVRSIRSSPARKSARPGRPRTAVPRRYPPGLRDRCRRRASRRPRSRLRQA